MQSPLPRRRFMAGAGCAALGSTGLLSSAVNLALATKVAAAEASDTSDYKALVCIFLLGGNDSFNMLAPTNRDEYAYYLNRRGGVGKLGGSQEDVGTGGLAIAAPGQGADALLPIQPFNIPGRSFGIYPRMPEIQKLFQEKSLAFVSNIGSLQKPFASVEAYKNDSADCPLGLFSHSDQQQQWQSCMPDKRTGIGWAGRAMDVLQRDLSAGQKFAFNISMSGTNILQTGNRVVPYSMNVKGLTPLRGYDPKAGAPGAGAPLPAEVDYARMSATKALMSGVYRNIFESTYVQTSVEAQEAFDEVKSRLHEDAYPNWQPADAAKLEAQLKLVANMIAGFKDTKTKRQTFFISIAGFDMHHNLMKEQPDLLRTVSESIGKFWDNLSPETKKSVTLFTASDFGRTLTNNGSGADHGWGGNQFVLGGAVKGGQIYGHYPIFAETVISPTYDVGQGRLIPSYSVEEYVYPILKWFGLSDQELFATVFPGYAARFGSGGIRETYRLYG